MNVSSLPVVACLLFLLAFSLPMAAGGQTVAAESPSGPIPASFFGLSVAYLTVSGPRFPVNVPVGTLGKTQGTEWNDVEPSNGTYNWAPLDSTIDSASASGITKFVYTFWSTPEWASSAPTQTCILTPIENVTGCAAPPEYIGDWDAFVKAVVTRYEGRIQYFELWNEANLAETYTGTVSEMVTMAQHAYLDIKSIDPSAVVLTPSVSRVGVLQYSQGCSISECFLAEYLKAGGGAYADAVAYHPYACYANESACEALNIACPQGEIQECTGTPLATEIGDLRSIMSAYGLSRLPLVATEGGFPSDIIGPGLLGSADQQTAYVSRWYIIQASLNVSLAVWFTEFEPEDGLAGFGTSNAQAEINQGYNQTYQWLVDSTFQGPCALNGPIWSCDIVRADGTGAQIVFADTGVLPVPYSPPAGYAEYQELNGSQYPLGGTLDVGMEPILLMSQVSTSSASTSSSSASTSAASTGSTQPSSSASSSSATVSIQTASQSSSAQSSLQSAVLRPIAAVAAVCTVVLLLGRGSRNGMQSGRRVRRT